MTYFDDLADMASMPLFISSILKSLTNIFLFQLTSISASHLVTQVGKGRSFYLCYSLNVMKDRMMLVLTCVIKWKALYVGQRSKIAETTM